MHERARATQTSQKSEVRKCGYRGCVFVFKGVSPKKAREHIDEHLKRRSLGIQGLEPRSGINKGGTAEERFTHRPRIKKNSPVEIRAIMSSTDFIKLSYAGRRIIVMLCERGVYDKKSAVDNKQIEKEAGLTKEEIGQAKSTLKRRGVVDTIVNTDNLRTTSIFLALKPKK